MVVMTEKKRLKSTLTKNKKVVSQILTTFSRAQNRNRTCTPFRKQDFESSASTSSAIWAKQLSFSCGLQMYIKYSKSQTFFFYVKSSSLNGSFLTLFPVRSKIALHNAGANAGTPGSPTPPGFSSFSIICTSISGISLILGIG